MIMRRLVLTMVVLAMVSFGAKSSCRYEDDEIETTTTDDEEDVVVGMTEEPLTPEEIEIEDAYGEGDYRRCFELAMRMEENALAQFYLGSMYFNGNGVSESLDEAYNWFEKSAEQGFAASQYMLGLKNEMYNQYDEAFEWYSKAAEQGFELAQTKLGIAYEFGIGCEQDFKNAALWFGVAAEAGDSEAQYYLGELYYFGDGVEQNNDEAAEWFKFAAEQGNESAQALLTKILSPSDEGVIDEVIESYNWTSSEVDRNPTVKRLSEQEITENRTPAAKAYNFVMAILDGDEDGIKKDYSRSPQWGGENEDDVKAAMEENFSKGKREILKWKDALATGDYEIVPVYVQDLSYYIEDASTYHNIFQIVRNGKIYVPNEKGPKDTVLSQGIYIACVPVTEIGRKGFQDISNIGDMSVEVRTEYIDGRWKVTG